MSNIPPLEANQQSTPLLLTLPSAMTSNAMEPLINTTCETSSATIPMDTQRKSLIDITPIPNRDTSHSQVNLMSQTGTSNTQRYQNNNTNMTFNSQGLSQPPRQQQPTMVQELNTSKAQPSLHPLDTHPTYQQQHQPP